MWGLAGGQVRLPASPRSSARSKQRNERSAGTLGAMCRYALNGPYRDHYACFSCRKSYKWPHDRNVDPATLPSPVCPQCGGPVEAMGLDFKAPPTDDVAQWEKVRVLADHGLRYTSCGCGGPGPRPEHLRDVEAFFPIPSGCQGKVSAP